MDCATLLELELVDEPFYEVCGIGVPRENFTTQQNLDEEKEAYTKAQTLFLCTQTTKPTADDFKPYNRRLQTKANARTQFRWTPTHGSTVIDIETVTQ